jgi:hypothetical protein
LGLYDILKLKSKKQDIRLISKRSHSVKLSRNIYFKYTIDY